MQEAAKLCHKVTFFSVIKFPFSAPTVLKGRALVSASWGFLKSPKDFPGGSDGKASVYNVGDLGSIPGLGSSLEKEMATHFRTLV